MEDLAVVLVTGVFVSISDLCTRQFYGALLLFLSLLLPLLSFASFILVRIFIFTSAARLDIIFYVLFLRSLVFLNILVRLSLLFDCSYHLLFPALEMFLLFPFQFPSFPNFSFFVFFTIVLTFFYFLLHFNISFVNVVFFFCSFFYIFYSVFTSFSEVEGLYRDLIHLKCQVDLDVPRNGEIDTDENL